VALLTASPDYSSRDFDALRARLISLVKSTFPEWTDFDVASFGNILLEMFAFVGDVTSFYLDGLARESRLSTATQRRNVIALAKMLGYRLPGASAATAEVEFTLDRSTAGAVTIPAGTSVRTEEVTEPVRFQLLTTATIAAGQRTALGVVEHSAAHTQLFDARGREDLEVPLDGVPYLDGSLQVSTAQGAFTEVPTFLNSSPNDRHFVVSVDQNDRATVRFGRGANGLPPAGTITFKYKTGGGAAGNVEAGRITVLEGAYRDAFGNPVQLTVRNPAPASGGLERQTVAAAKLLAPERLRVLTRTVAREDFEIHARLVPGVARALMLTSNEDRGVAENSGILYLVPAGGGAPTSALKAAVQTQVTETYPCPLTFQVAVQDPVYRAIRVGARLFIRAGADRVRVAQAVRQNLVEYFRITEPDGTPNRRIDFGHNLRADGAASGDLAWSDLFNVVRDTPGVRKLNSAELTLNGAAADVTLAVREFPVLSGVDLWDAETGAVL
jgi:hypothetical protein